MSNLEYPGASERTAIAGSQERQGLTAGDTWSQCNQNKLQPKYDSAAAHALLPPDPFGNIDAQVAQLSGQEKQVTAYGVPAIERKGVTYLVGETSNVPRVTQGVQNLNDLSALGGAIANTAVQGIEATTSTWSKSPYVVNESLLSIGPALDTAVNYYGSTNFDQVGRDAQSALGALSESIDDKFGRPITVKEQGQHIESASLFKHVQSVQPNSKYRKRRRGCGSGSTWGRVAQGLV